MRITVIGAGVAGLTSALALAERGCEVEVLERGPALGAASCSRWAGGMLAPWCEAETAEPVIFRLGTHSLKLWREYFPEMPFNGSLVVPMFDLAGHVTEVYGRKLLDNLRAGTPLPVPAGVFPRHVEPEPA